MANLCRRGGGGTGIRQILDYSACGVGMLEGLKASGECPTYDFLGPASLKEYNALE